MASAVRYLGSIYIWEASVAYRLEVQKYLELVRTTHAGRSLFQHINMKPRWMLISPFKPTQKDPVNAYAFPDPATDADAYPKDYVASKVSLRLPLLGSVDIPTKIGTGQGSVVHVAYHPATWRQRAINTGHIATGAGPGEVLFHEMVHGYRMQSGLLRTNDAVAGEPHMDNVEEFHSILASNVYRSERGFTTLRADHWGFNHLKSGVNASDSFYENYKPLIDKWFSEQAAFCMAMARSPAKFNPFREAAIALGLMPRPAVSMRL